MEIKVTKIVSMTSNVEATVNGLSINANVRVRNNDTIENVDGGNVKDSTGEQQAERQTVQHSIMESDRLFNIKKLRLQNNILIFAP